MKASIAAMLVVCALPAAADTMFTVAGDTFTRSAGFPWTGNTNYYYKISDGTQAVTGTNAHLPVFSGIVWQDYENRVVTVEGSLPALPDDATGYLQIGFVTKDMADIASAGYASFMVNGSVFGTFHDSGAAMGDKAPTAPGDYSPNLAVDRTLPLTYQMLFDFNSDQAQLRIAQGNGWSQAVSVAFGNSNSGAEGKEDFSQAAFLVSYYAEYSGTATITYDEIDVTVSDAIPEPSTWMMMAGGLIALGIRLRRRA